MNQKIENIIPLAFSAIQEARLVKEGAVSKQYNGYISSFGAAVIQSGLLAALVFNHRGTSRSEKDRKLLMDAIFIIVKQVRNVPNSQDYRNLLDYVAQIPHDKPRLKRQILDAATAIKLVIRTYHLTEDNDE